MDLSTRRQLRAVALSKAVQLHTAIDGDLVLQVGDDRESILDDLRAEIRETADFFDTYLQGTTKLTLTHGPILSQETGNPTGTQPNGDGTMQLIDDEKVTYTADTEDARGFDTKETMVWTIDDPAVATVEVGSDGRTATVVAAAPGSTTLTVDITSLDPPLQATEAIDVIVGGTTKVTLVPGEVTKQ